MPGLSHALASSGVQEVVVWTLLLLPVIQPRKSQEKLDKYGPPQYHAGRQLQHLQRVSVELAAEEARTDWNTASGYLSI